MSGSTAGLLRTAAAARSIGVSTRTLQQWAQDGNVRPTAWTPGGHARWDASDLRQQLNELHQAWT